ncbi:bifunctional diaminohydroxyphosphoribosylaminopyrimidine deaminase/5-amino-6-(5-phosphoribosylamino)uracil reductase RibD [Klugiella xanthotipulae]|uniref:Riboflavin biosynthesis protein RibD n=1 Tax=Klugiella xanthotipulae TaxID=244735 RepID=A0A543HYP5_9MICO|nr:bifunctional diaminohydroxyphosphoribosylaminopyrimidine deaminase/5-amino-6-(5-phosphoribosylamino)uracil reductase RibD [Klugiella xanthotipulae]TQM63463.1 diaminohydroxyphosphoribosylaminopyrimidine deaminase/5-amino-6-(5-phosphoribosylamino)uracil reductase [Klugiella xanthotipulae]
MVPTPDALTAAMRRALQLAALGPDRDVNPQVGCVILAADGTVVAEGWHGGSGSPHAEVVALAGLPVPLRTPEAARQLTAVVTLEPCNHTGRTGPCAIALIEAGIGAVYFAVSDSDPVAGGGADRLRAAGIPTEGGLLRAEVERFLAPWLTYRALGRPRVTLKWASSLDGRTAAADGTSQWITGPQARADVHLRRSRADAILVGTGTALADNPSLTARAADGTLLERQPIPVVVGDTVIPEEAALYAHPTPPLFYPGHDLAATLTALGSRGIRSVFVEGGPRVASALVRHGLVDEVLVYLAPVLLGGPRMALDSIGVTTIGGARRFTPVHTHTLGEDILIVAQPTAPIPNTEDN